MKTYLDLLLYFKQVTADADMMNNVLVDVCGTDWYDYIHTSLTHSKLDINKWKGKLSKKNFSDAVCIIDRYHEQFSLLGVKTQIIKFNSSQSGIKEGEVKLELSPAQIGMNIGFRSTTFIISRIYLL